MTPTPTSTPQATLTNAVKVTPTNAQKRIYIDGLSFAAQAPFGDWKDPIQQDGCEEASSMVAVSWAIGKKFDKGEALKMIQDISAYEVRHFGQARDTSAYETNERIIKGYFGYENSKVVELDSVVQIIDWLLADNLIIVPANGQKLGNPYFTSPGPDRHMLVIRGYDFEKKEFITNEVGTRQGENFRYPQETLFTAIRDYPTGNHLPISGNSKMAILVWR